MSPDRPPRIAVGGLHTECSTYNPVLMRDADFRFLRGEALLAHPEFALLHDYPDVHWSPTLHCRAIAGGPIEAGTYRAFKAEFLQRLSDAGPIDGLYLAMHGAAFVAGMEDAEADWIEAARAAVGPDCPIAVSYDLHGNVSQRVIDALDMFSAYRTAPHIDVDDTKRRACAMLVRALRDGERPSIAWARIPVLLPGERTSTEDEPARRLYAALPAYDARPGVLDASLMVGYVWADEKRATASAIVTGTDPAAMRAAAAEIAQSYWDARHEFAFGTTAGTIDECLDIAAAASTRPAVLADSGDNPTGGGVGDRVDVLRRLIARGESDVLLAGIVDRPAAEACFVAGAGAILDLTIGGSLDPSGGSVPVRARVRNLDPAERQAVIETGGITIVLTARRRPFHSIADFSRLNLDPRAVRLLVVKSGYLSPELAPLACPSLMALSPGVVDQDVARLPIVRTPRPMFPFDRDFDWSPRVLASGRATRP